MVEIHRLIATLPPRATPQRIELCSTVIYSRCDLLTKTQRFFADLFFPHDPPYTGWAVSDLFDEGSALVLDPVGEPKLSRAIAQVNKKGKKKEESDRERKPWQIESRVRALGKTRQAGRK